MENNRILLLFLGGPDNTITLFQDAVNIKLWLSNVQCGDYFSRATMRGMLLQFSRAFPLEQVPISCVSVQSNEKL